MTSPPRTRGSRTLDTLGIGRAPAQEAGVGRAYFARRAARGRAASGAVGVLLAGLLLVQPLVAERTHASHQPLQADAPAVTYAGFQKLGEGRFRLFVRLTDKPKLVAAKSGKEATFLFEGARVLVSNNKNPLNFKHFNTSLHRAQLNPAEDGVELALSFKRTVKLEHRFVERADGSVTFQVDFPGALAK